MLQSCYSNVSECDSNVTVEGVYGGTVTSVKQLGVNEFPVFLYMFVTVVTVKNSDRKLPIFLENRVVQARILQKSMD